MKLLPMFPFSERSLKIAVGKAGEIGISALIYLNHLSIETSNLSITPNLASTKNTIIPRMIPIPKA
jgi:hypothetical protein